MSNLNPRTVDAIERSIASDHGERPYQIAARCDGWSLSTVRAALRELVAQGRVAYSGPDCQRHYWRISKSNQGVSYGRPQ